VISVHDIGVHKSSGISRTSIFDHSGKNVHGLYNEAWYIKRNICTKSMQWRTLMHSFTDRSQAKDYTITVTFFHFIVLNFWIWNEGFDGYEEIAGAYQEDTPVMSLS
jgi:hypothetical protein